MILLCTHTGEEIIVQDGPTFLMIRDGKPPRVIEPGVDPLMFAQVAKVKWGLRYIEGNDGQRFPEFPFGKFPKLRLDESRNVFVLL